MRRMYSDTKNWKEANVLLREDIESKDFTHFAGPLAVPAWVTISVMV